MVRQCTMRNMCVTLVMVMCLSVEAGPQEGKEHSLYQRVGGYDAIAALVDDFVPRLATDAQLSRFFTGHSSDSKKTLRQHVINMICSSTGGPCAYTGRPLKVAHGGLGITESDWQTMWKHLMACLEHLKMPKKEQGEFVAFVESLKPDIVEPGKAEIINR